MSLTWDTRTQSSLSPFDLKIKIEIVQKRSHSKMLDSGHGTGLALLNNIFGIALKCGFQFWCLVVALSQANS